MKVSSTFFFILFIIIVIFFVYYSLSPLKIIYDALKGKRNDEDSKVPTVSFPFKNLFDDENKKLNIILISAPFRTEEHEKQYIEYKNQGFDFCGISSYLDFPGKINNPYEDRFHEERGHDYTKMVSSWLHCFRKPPQNLIDSGLPMMLLAEADLKNPDIVKYNPNESKEYDFIYVCLNDGDGSKCEPGWNWHIRNWDLAKKCLVVMCKKYKLRGVIVGRENCEFTEFCSGIVKVVPFLKYDEFQKMMRKCRFLFAPNITDASPRVITEAMCYNMPVLLNFNILGGWNNVIPGTTGEFFTDENNVSIALDRLLNNFESYTPREWFKNNRGKKISGKLLADFLIQNYPNINKKKMEFATISI